MRHQTTAVDRLPVVAFADAATDGFRNLYTKTTRPASAPKPTTAGPGRPPGSRNRRPARHDLGPRSSGGDGTANTHRISVCERGRPVSCP
jgi:hypothetical protein